jgi:phospholipid/cholesterol/gamma-HCH transport system substrate-binding protein
MKRTTKIKWGEIKVGFLIIVAVALLIWASFSGGGTSIFQSKVKYRAYFDNVNGLVAGSPVWVAGIEAGNVISVEFVNLDSARQIEAKFRVLNKVTNMITTDARVKLGTIGFIGDKYLEIIPGTLTNPRLEPESVIITEPSGDLNAVFAQGQEAVSDAGRLMTNLSEITDRVGKGQGFFGKLVTEDTLYTELTRLLSAMTVLIADIQRNQERITVSLENVSKNLNNVVTKVNENQGTLGRIISDPGLYNNLHSSAGRIDSILARIEDGRGTAGAMVNDDELYQEIRNLVVRIDNLVSDIEKNPRKYFKFSVF